MKKFIRCGLPLLILCVWQAAGQTSAGRWPAVGQRSSAGSGQWRAIGPYGGDVRSLAADPLDPSHLFLGTSNGQIYTSADGGRRWSHLSELAPRHDLVVDDLLVDTHDRHLLYAGAWSLEGTGGGVFRSADAGLTWTDLPGMSGRSVRALVVAPGRRNTLVAGALEGVFRSTNSGASWQRISPANDPEIRNIESLAVDPDDPAVIYAGTWHLPWKTVDGGANWFSIKSGIIEDSDVFSIAVDWSNRRTVYLSACSGIYRSDTEGRQWSKIQGIPYSARRTRVIRQDPRNPEVVYAGTTEGLWKTDSAGAAWRRLTSASLTVNDILIDASDPSHLFLATERAGVLESADGGETFRAANQGFSHRQLSRLMVDPQSGHVLVSVIHDKENGGVYAAADSAVLNAECPPAAGNAELRKFPNPQSASCDPPSEDSPWQQWSEGLEGGDVLALARVPGGDLLAATADGLFRFRQDRQAWERTGRLWKAESPQQPRSRRTARATGQTSAGSRSADMPSGQKQRVAVPLTLRINDLALAPAADQYEALVRAAIARRDWTSLPPPPKVVYAATSEGVLRSTDGGQNWQPISPAWPVDRVVVSPNLLVAATSSGIAFSTSGGDRWVFGSLPAEGVSTSGLVVVGNIQAGAFCGDCETIYAATNRGLFRSPDTGHTWEHKGGGVPFGPVSDVLVDPADPGRVYVAALTTGVVYYSADGGRSYQPLNRNGVAGRQPLRLAFSSNGVLHLATANDGAFVWLVEAPRAVLEKTGQ